jgi:hypothetical protein
MTNCLKKGCKKKAIEGQMFCADHQGVIKKENDHSMDSLRYLTELPAAPCKKNKSERKSRWNPYSFKRDFIVTGKDMNHCRNLGIAIRFAAKQQKVNICTKVKGTQVFVWIFKNKP